MLLDTIVTLDLMMMTISSQYHCQRFSPLQISGTLQVGFELGQNLSSGFNEFCRNCVEMRKRKEN